MRKWRQTNVLLLGLTGPGLEAAKDLVLSGPKSLHIKEDMLIEKRDLSIGFYFSEADIGKKMTDVAIPKLRERNTQVNVSEVRDFDVKDYDVVILVNPTHGYAIDIDNECRKKDTCFILVKTHGLFGEIFCDFGDEFVVDDVDGEQPAHVPIAKMTRNDRVEIIASGTSTHDLCKGSDIIIHNTHTDEEFGPFEIIDVVRKEVDGEKVKVILIDDDNTLDVNDKYCDLREVKKQKIVKFKSLSDELAEPELLGYDFGHESYPRTISFGFQLLSKFLNERLRLPHVRNAKDYELFVKDTEIPDDIDTDLLREICYQARGQVVGMTSLFGGLAAKEAFKAGTNKYMPLKHFAFESIKTLPEDLTEEDCQSIDSRYDAQINVMGKKHQEKLAGTKLFMVGVGALGCEHLRTFCMMGVGEVHMTDNDTIELSNLNRQFLFGKENVGQPKAVAAAAAAQVMNPYVKVVAYEKKVCPESLPFFAPLFASADVIVNALDNMTARLYVDELCVRYSKPLLESGTMGTKCNTQVVVPNLTETYGSSQDPPETSIPLCTLKFFPNSINHTIPLARDNFEELFVKPYNDALKVMRGDDLSQLPIGELPDILKHAEVCLTRQPKSYNDCLRMAYREWMKQFNINIRNLLEQYPVDHKMEDGTEFWSGGKRVPHPHEFDPQNDMTKAFMVNFANITARIYGLCTIEVTDELLRDIASTTDTSDLEKTKEKITATEEEEKKRIEEMKKRVEEEMDKDAILHKLKTLKYDTCSIEPEEFEKDDDSNGHIDIVNAMSNLRAMNYNITPVDRLETKKIAGKIIPAIATTTAVASSLIMLELPKLLHSKASVEDYRNAFVNLATPFITTVDPVEAEKTEINGKNYTLWSTVDVRDDPTVSELVDRLEDEFDGDISTICYGSKFIHNMYLPGTKKYANVKLSEIIGDVRKGDIYTFVPVLDVDIDEEGMDGGPNLPNVRFFA